MTQQITVYTTPTCTWCTAVKQYLEEKGLSYDEVDVSADVQRARELVERTGQYGVPVIDVDGEFVVGFDRARLEALLTTSA